MKIVKLTDIENTDREVHCPNKGFISYRYLLEKDGMGFSVHKTVIPAGVKQHWHYKNHLEACFCIQGVGMLLTWDSSGERCKSTEIVVDTLYALDKNDEHWFTAIEDVVLISIFNPPLTGSEVHREDGSYE